MRGLAFTTWLLAGLALLLGFAREPLLGSMPRPRELPRADGGTGIPWMSGGFVAPEGLQEISPGRVPVHIQKTSSGVEGDEWQGRAESSWFRARRMIIHVGIAGYPQAEGCRVWAEFQMSDGRTIQMDCPLPDPREEWNVWEIRRPRGAVAVRILGEDRSSAHAGWVAFSHPFRAWPGAVTAGYLALQVLTTTALAFVLIFGPGLLWARPEASPLTRLILLLGTGPLTLAVFGVLIWCAAGWVRPQIAGLVLVGSLWLWLGARGWRRGRGSLAGGEGLKRMLLLTALVAVAVVAKSGYSAGPEGELFRGTVSRNMEMSDRIDSRFSFYVVQAAAHHWGPASAQTERFHAPWTFFSRGPLAGLLAIPIVMATNGRPPAELPEGRWSPFDPTGFAAYRITMIVLASSIIVALFLALCPLLGAAWAFIAGALLALTPFGLHEMLFTWPKWTATAWLLASFGLAHTRRPAAAGLALATGFLFHPLALLWAPWLALWAAGRGERQWRQVAATLLWFGAGAAALVLPWMAIGALLPHLPDTVFAGQAGFLRYWRLADWHVATWETWWQTRWMNFANTFVPLHLYLHEASFSHPKLGSAYEDSGTLVKLTQLWWTSLPFGMGLGLWALGLVAAWQALRTHAAAAVLFVIAPAVFVTAYWGMDPLGWLRECGHPIFVAIIALACAVAKREGSTIGAVLQHRIRPWLQLPEVWLMLWLTTLLNRKPWAVYFDHLDGWYFAASTAALVAAAFVASGRGPSRRPAP